MLCDYCKKNNANVHITKIINGNKQELNLCDSCAEKLQGLSHSDMANVDLSSSLTFQNILSGIMDYISGSSLPSEKVQEPVCKACGMKLGEFRESGLLGCADCYKYFSNTVTPVIRRVQSSTEHIGKIPKKYGKDILTKRKVIKLKEELQKAIAGEEYEKAAGLRDQIRDLQNESRGD